jgi:hypothetical protein
LCSISALWHSALLIGAKRIPGRDAALPVGSVYASSLIRLRLQLHGPENILAEIDSNSGNFFMDGLPSLWRGSWLLPDLIWRGSWRSGGPVRLRHVR